jgi:hypothetical protein
MYNRGHRLDSIFFAMDLLVEVWIFPGSHMNYTRYPEVGPCDVNLPDNAQTGNVIGRRRVNRA